MAFGFIKKVFSFGKKDVEQRLAEDAPLPPINWDALKPIEQPVADAPQAPVEPVVSEQAAPATEPATLPAEAPEPAPALQETPAEPAPEPTPVAPPSPPEPIEPAPVEVPAAPPSLAPEPAVPQEMPAEQEPATPEPQPAEEPAPTPIEIPVEPERPASPVEPEQQPETPPVEIPAPTPSPVEMPPSSGPAILPDAESLAPAGQPAPIDADRLAVEIAPEPAPAPKPAAGKVTVAKKVEQKTETVAPAAPTVRTTWFQRLREGLSRSSRELSGNIAGVFTKRKLDEETLQDLEDVLIRADLGMETAIRVTDALSASRYGKDVSDADVRNIMAVEIEKVLKPVAMPLELDLSHKPHVILVVGVNGTGKTTTIGKLAAKLTEGGLSVMLAAGDTFRAAAIEQLKIWGERTKSPVIASKLGADAAGLAWDAFEKARQAGSDVLIIDTAGRLQNRTELMAELEKIVRVLGKHDPEAPHTVLQTVDATTGQNALNQVEIFRNIAGVNGLVMTKLDGTARGGILVAIAAKHKLPVYFIGVGEQVDDLEPFSAGDFAKAIAGVA